MRPGIAYRHSLMVARHSLKLGTKTRSNGVRTKGHPSAPHPKEPGKLRRHFRTKSWGRAAQGSGHKAQGAKHKVQGTVRKVRRGGGSLI